MTPNPALHHPEALRFQKNLVYRDDWEQQGGRIVRQPSGHTVLYDEQGHRVLYSDPQGNPLHECLWQTDASGNPVLRLARIRLDWGHWVGIKPEGLVNTITLDLSQKPGWERLTRHDLRLMAAQAMNVDVETIHFFYRDEDLLIQDNGQATIRQVKDAFYLLPEGSFDRAIFMSCMSRMEWERIHYLPVVELFLSLLPGTGSATFELIRELYQDQNPHQPLPLQYRGIPVYPSEGAYRLFGMFFTPSMETGESPLEVFLNPDRSHEVQWNPSAQYPRRYFENTQRIGVTIHQRKVQKVTCWDDPAGLSYFPMLPSGQGSADGRGLQTIGQELILHDESHERRIPLQTSWNLNTDNEPIPWVKPLSSWKDFFPKGAPDIHPHQAFSAVLLYPDGSALIGEKESQPFVFDYVDDLLEQQPEIQNVRDLADRILLIRCEASLGSCIRYQRPQSYTIWYEWPEFAQKNALRVWNTIQRKHPNWVKNFVFLPVADQVLTSPQSPFDWIEMWVPFAAYENPQQMEQWSWFLAHHVIPGGLACIAGPTMMGHSLEKQGFSIVHAEKGEDLPTFRIHQTILPSAWLHPELTLWVVQQS